MGIAHGGFAVGPPAQERLRFLPAPATPPERLFVLEYLLCFSPLVVLSIIAGTYSNAFLYLFAPICVGLSPGPGAGARNPLLIKRIPRFLNVRSLELISFVRKNFILLSALSTLAAVFSYVPVASIIILMLLVLIMGNAYVENEPLDMVLLPERGAAGYLKSKVLAGYLLFLKLSAPALLLYAALNPRTAYLALIPLVAAPVNIALFVFFKYTRYETGRRDVAIPLAV